MNRLPRKNAISIGQAIEDMLRASKMASGLNTRLVYSAWDKASGAGRFTIKRYYRDGKLYITTSSSVVCSQLSFQKQALLDRMNAILSSDPLFISDDPRAGFVKELILK